MHDDCEPPLVRDAAASASSTSMASSAGLAILCLLLLELSPSPCSRSLGRLSPRYRRKLFSMPVLLPTDDTVLTIGDPMLRSMSSAPYWTSRGVYPLVVL